MRLLPFGVLSIVFFRKPMVLLMFLILFSCNESFVTFSAFAMVFTMLGQAWKIYTSFERIVWEPSKDEVLSIGMELLIHVVWEMVKPSSGFLKERPVPDGRGQVDI